MLWFSARFGARFVMRLIRAVAQRTYWRWLHGLRLKLRRLRVIMLRYALFLYEFSRDYANSGCSRRRLEKCADLADVARCPAGRAKCMHAKRNSILAYIAAQDNAGDLSWWGRCRICRRPPSIGAPRPDVEIRPRAAAAPRGRLL